MASQAVASPTYYRLYVVKKFDAGREAVESRGYIYFVFCMTRKDPTMKVFKWFYGAWAHCHWFPKHDGCLGHANSEGGFQGLVDGRHIEDKDSEVRKLLDFMDEDQKGLVAGWNKACDAKVKAEQTKWQPGEFSDEELRKCVESEYCAQWQKGYMYNLAEERINLLKERKLLLGA